MSRAIKERIANLCIFAAVVGTLMITPWMNWDPINLGKILVISSASFAAVFLVFSSKQWMFSNVTSYSMIPFGCFLFSLCIPLLFSGAPLSQQFWGISGRNTGFLTYLSLAFLAFSISTASGKKLENKIINWLLVTGVVLAVYGIVQILDLDPIGWSQFAVFGTLGNVNFFASFTALIIVAVFALLIQSREIFRPHERIGFLIFFGIVFWINLKTDSMQGPVTSIIGCVSAFFATIWTRKIFSARKFLTIVSLPIIILGIPAILGLLNMGPLARYLYQDSNVFRKDYMLAGWHMSLANPLTGVGLDSYDNWYRKFRGLVAAYRTGPNRTSNSAHNVWLDLSSGGGFLLLISYLMVVFLAFYLAIKVFRYCTSINPYYLALFACFVAYHFQTLLSINQVGLGVWGWLFTGALIGQSRYHLENIGEKEHTDKRLDTKVKKKSSGNSSALPAISSLFSIVGFIFGFILAYIPMSSDASFRTALNSRNLGNVVTATDKKGINAFQISKAAQVALESGNTEVAHNVVSRLTKTFPREIYGWDLVLRLPQSTAAERSTATTQMKKIDPNFFCLEPSPELAFKSNFSSLREGQKAELLAWWGLVPRKGATASQVESAMNSQDFESRIAALCR